MGIGRLSLAILCLTGCLVLSSNALEFDVLEAFDLKDGINGVQLVNGCGFSRGYLFAKTPTDISADARIVDEFLGLLQKQASFIAVMKVRPEPYHKGSILWLQQKSSGTTLFGLWLRSGKNGKIGLHYYGDGGEQSLTLNDNVDNEDLGWKYLVLHYHKASHGHTIDVYVDCVKVATRKAKLNLKQAPRSDLELRLAQREVAGKIFSRWKGGLADFRFIFGRNISTYIRSDRCNKDWSRVHSPPLGVDRSRTHADKNQAIHANGYDDYRAALTSPLTSISQSDVSAILSRITNMNIGAEAATNALMKEILDVVKDVQSAQSNQIFELKSLKELLQIIGTSQQGLGWEALATKDDQAPPGSDLKSDRNPCHEKPCYPFVSCTPGVDGVGFKCGQCPIGLEGDGQNCTDIDECEEHPCSPVSACVNKVPGYLCLACPAGYRGEESVGIGREQARIKKQMCNDIDECSEGKHICDPNAECINQKGGYRCGNCKAGYVKDAAGACLMAEICQGRGSPSNPCSIYAHCENVDGRPLCQCRPGYAGNGYVCGVDGDGDGFPNEKVDCESKHCQVDNCPFSPNSGQEDYDRDGKGDVCDSDIDGDSIYNSLDNCPFARNKNQKNSDADAYGDECDNCLFMSNPEQLDIDQDGQGDACDRDMDGDGVLNIVDNCPLTYNPGQMDRDMDSHGDACDNCPDADNPRQDDRDQDGYGDECDNDIDSDADGFPDTIDNCPRQPNAAQVDTDSDGSGDACDSDDDGDGIVDSIDNCPILPNPKQIDADGDGVGNDCESDSDGDGVGMGDTCPNDKLLHNTNFTQHDIIMLGAIDREAHKPPKWAVRHQGQEVAQFENAAPSLLLAKPRFDGFDFTGSLFVDTISDDDFVGLAFAFQNVRNFYLFSWKQKAQSYWRSKPSFLSRAQAGLELKYIHSDSGPDGDLRQALWHTGNYSGQSTLLWRDKEDRGWDDKVPYAWELMHRPALGLIRLVVHRNSERFIDTGYLFHDRLKGGRIGPYAFSQADLIWSKLRIVCNETLPAEVMMAIQPL